MRAFIFTAALLLAPGLAQSTHARDLPDVRPVETQSVDVFAVLQTLHRAEMQFETRQYAAALRGFHLVHAHDPRMPAARTGLRRSYLARGDWQAAARYADANDIADRALIAALRDGNATPLKHALVREHNDPRLWTALGRLQDRAGEHAQARKSYQAADRTGARPGLASNNIGQSFLLEGHPDLALEAFTAATTLDPNDMRFDNNRRRALLALGRLPEAITDLTATRASTFLAEAGRTALVEDNTGLARELLSAAQRMSPRYNPAIAALAKRARR